MHSPKSNEFYEEQNLLRRYFYVIDTKGQVFQESTKHRNFVTCMKDLAFLNMLHSLLRPNRTTMFPEYPLYFPCGQEHNFVITEDKKSVLGFSKIITKDNQKQLFFGNSNVTQAFDASALYCCPDTGRFYHIIQKQKHLKGQLGLLHPQVSESLSENIKLSQHGDYFEYSNEQGQKFIIKDTSTFDRQNM